MTVQAIFENGLLRPIKPLALPEGECVELILVPKENQGQAPVFVPVPGFPAQAIARIAALPRQGQVAGFSARDHDRVLYGANGAR